MIYIATVHWKDDKWIQLQRQFLDRYIQEPFKVYAYLTDIPKAEEKYFDHIRDNDDPSHAQKLNILAQDIISASENDADVIIFLDGDAFPIAPVAQWAHEMLAQYPLIAVQRTENIGDIQPHPCFCVSSVKFWKEIAGDWSDGYQWLLENGVWQTDVGGNLLKLLEDRSVNWYKMHRTNTLNLDDLMFAIYDDLIYHHGSGFRLQKGGRVALDKAGARSLFKRLDVRILEKCIPKHQLMRVRYSLFHPYGRKRRRLFRKLSMQSDTVYKNLMSNPDYVHTFMEPVSS